jgi:hypothetical protein
MDAAEHSRLIQPHQSEEEKIQELLRDGFLLTQLTQDVQDDDPDEVLDYAALGKRKRAEVSNEESLAKRSCAQAWLGGRQA